MEHAEVDHIVEVGGEFQPPAVELEVDGARLSGYDHGYRSVVARPGVVGRAGEQEYLFLRQMA